MSAPVANVASASGVTVSGGAQGALRALAQAGNLNPFLAFLGNTAAQTGTGNSSSQTSGDVMTLRNGVQVQIYTASGTDGSPSFYLANIQSNKFPDDVLMALTKGVPTHLLPQGSEDALEPMTMEQLSSLISSNSEALKSGNILLVAANFTPEEMDSLAKQLAEALEKMKNPDPTLPVAGSAELSDAAPITEEPEEKNLHFYLVQMQTVGATMAATSTSTSTTDEECGINEIPDSVLPPYAQKDKGLNNEVMDWSIVSALFGKPVVAPATDAAAGTTQSASPFSSPALSGQGDELAPFEVAFNSAKQSAGLGNSYQANNKSQGHKDGAVSGHVSGDAQTPSTTLGLDWSLPVDWMNGKLGLDLSSTLSSAHGGLSAPATGTTPAQIATATPILSYSSAGAAHPATQALAARLEKSSENGESKTQTISVELDPPELGRVQVHLSYEKGEPMKVKVVTEKEETLSILRRDSHALREALENAGVQTDGSSLSFDMSQDQSAFQQALNSSGQDHNSRGFNLSGDGTTSTDLTLSIPGLEDISTSLNLVTDEKTGHVSYNLLA